MSVSPKKDHFYIAQKGSSLFWANITLKYDAKHEHLTTFINFSPIGNFSQFDCFFILCYNLIMLLLLYIIFNKGGLQYD